MAGDKIIDRFSLFLDKLPHLWCKIDPWSYGTQNSFEKNYGCAIYIAASTSELLGDIAGSGTSNFSQILLHIM